MTVAQAAFAATLVDEWVRAGVTDAVVCPGSRSTPLALALAERLRVHVRLDERSAGFFAIGLAVATGRPAVVCVTSGTAAAELHPSVVEAHHAGVPLVVCTADRPPELHGVGAPQTIDQAGLYGTAVRWAADPGVAVVETAASWRSLGSRAVAEALRGPSGPGPVHLNLAFREPLVADHGPLPAGRPGGRPWHEVQAAVSATQAEWPGRCGVVVAGDRCGPPETVLALAEHLGWPVLADPRSRCRRDHPCVVGAADAIARASPGHLVPDTVVRVGESWASKALAAFLSPAVAIVVDPRWRWQDPDRTAAVVHRTDPGAWLVAALDAPAPTPPADWLAGWQAAERAAQGAIDEALPRGSLTEPEVARRLLSVVPEATTVVVASSMPVRDLESFARPMRAPPRVVANRGANGIDGVCSTALGVAAAGNEPVVALVGDLAFLHDVSALLVPSSGPRLGSCTIVVVDNGGGGIFEHLPQAAAVDRARFEQLWGTRQAADVVSVAQGFGVQTADVGTSPGLDGALRAATQRQGICVIRVRVPARPENVAVHDRVHAAVAKALASAG